MTFSEVEEGLDFGAAASRVDAPATAAADPATAAAVDIPMGDDTAPE